MKFPLLPYSQLVFDMLQTNPDVYTTMFTLRIDKQKVDVARFQHAVETAVCNHPAFSIVVDKDGMQYASSLSDRFHSQYHSIDFVDEGDRVKVRVAYNRILGDTKSELVFFEDIIRAYQGLPLQPDHYWDYLERVEQEKALPRYAANRQWLEAQYGQISCPVHPRTDRSLNADDFGDEGVYMEDYTAMRSALIKLAEEQLLSLTAVFSLASALAIMEYNGTKDAALTWAYDGRETQEEHRIYGSLHRDIPFHIKVNGERLKVKGDLIRQARNQIRSGIAHSSYPLTLTKPHAYTWNVALNVLARPTVEEMDETFPFPFEVVSPADEQKPAYALLDVEILDTEQLYICYRYSASHYKPESIKKFADLVRKYVEWLLEE